MSDRHDLAAMNGHAQRATAYSVWASNTTLGSSATARVNRHRGAVHGRPRPLERPRTRTKSSGPRPALVVRRWRRSGHPGRAARRSPAPPRRRRGCRRSACRTTPDGGTNTTPVKSRAGRSGRRPRPDTNSAGKHERSPAAIAAVSEAGDRRTSSGEANWITRPRSRTTMRWASAIASTPSFVAITVVTP